jgi:hypothetical protein
MAAVVISLARRHDATDRLLEDRGIHYSANLGEIAYSAADRWSQIESDSK